MILTVASGKGGTGKTTVAVNLAIVGGNGITLLDTDVEEPNVHLFLTPEITTTEEVSVLVPEVDPALCDGCGECSAFCRFHAIVSLRTQPMVFPELCHSCGGCMLVCPRQAIREVPKRVGELIRTRSHGIDIVQGNLDVGVAMAVPLIKRVTANIGRSEHTVIDAPPGTSCSFVAATNPADYVLLVTEPTAFGLHDLTLSVESLRKTGKVFGVVINRAGSGDDRVSEYCRAEGIPILAEIPNDRNIAEAYSRGEIITTALPAYRKLFAGLWEKILNLTSDKKGMS